MMKRYKRAVLDAQIAALRKFFSAQPFSPDEFGINIGVLVSVVNEVYDRRDDDDVSDYTLDDLDEDDE